LTHVVENIDIGIETRHVLKDVIWVKRLFIQTVRSFYQEHLDRDQYGIITNTILDTVSFQFSW